MSEGGGCAGSPRDSPSCLLTNIVVLVERKWRGKPGSLWHGEEDVLSVIILPFVHSHKK